MDTQKFQTEIVPVVKSCLTDKFLDFKGRAGQHEFAIFILFCFIVNLISYTILPSGLAFLIGMALLVPALAVTVRRLHDIDLPEILAILLFIPVVNIIFLIYLGMQPTKTA